MSNFIKQKLWADNFLELQQEIINKYKNRLNFNKREKSNAFKYDIQKDCNENTDLILYKFYKLNIALRVRDINNCKYRDVTIRTYKDGYKTEIDKIKEGYGDYLLYCWGIIDNIPTIKEFVLMDLDIFRSNMKYFYVCEKDNFDGSKFAIFDTQKIIKTDCAIAVCLL